jgi:hypothetical protein
MTTQSQKFKNALTHPRYLYTRARNPSHPSGAWKTTDDLWVYVYGFGDKGYKHATASLPFNDAIPIMEEMGVPFPLSPTEGLGR